MRFWWRLGIGVWLLGAVGARADPAVPVVDLHVDLAYQVVYRARSPERASGQCLASELLGSRVVGLVLPLFVPRGVSPGGAAALEATYWQLEQVLRTVKPYAPPGGSIPGRVRTWLALEDAGPLAGHPEQVAEWVRRGVRIFGLVHTHDNELASSSGTGRRWPRPRHGLTPLGRELVRAIHRAGAMVDLSHASDLAVRDILELAREDGRPVVATHSNARRLAPHPRNLTDDQIRAIARSGGLVGVCFHGPYLAVGRRATLADVVGHVRYMAELVGPEHVAIGSDFEGTSTVPAELRDVRGFQRLAQALREAGFSAAAVEAIMAGNALRLLEGETRGVARPGR